MTCVFQRACVLGAKMNGVVRVENLGVDGFLSLKVGRNGDFVFKSLKFEGVLFTEVDNPLGFSQWVYLISPQVYVSVFAGTSLGHPPPFLVDFTGGIRGWGAQACLECELVARTVESMCDGDGVRLATRRFPLSFSRSVSKKHSQSLRAVAGARKNGKMSMQLTRYDCILSGDEVQLLNEAHLNWNDLDKFPEESVKTVKDVIRKVFLLEEGTSLLGVTLSDAIVLQDEKDNTLFFAMMKHDSGEWEAFQLGCGLGTIMFYKDASFKRVIDMLYLTRGVTFSDAGQPPSDE